MKRKLVIDSRPVGVAFALVWGVKAWQYASDGRPLIAVVVAMPAIVVFLARLGPFRAQINRALGRDIGGVADSELTPRQQELQLAVWWLFGSCLIPLGALLAFASKETGWFPEGHGIYVIFGGLIPLVGVACFLKSIGCFFRAWRVGES